MRRACSGDSELESEVVRLLAADESAGSFLEGHALSTLPPGSAGLHCSIFAPGCLISGRFEILRFIGQGGMGQVYEALDRELRTRVALKAIRPDISSDPRMLSRFRREVQLTRRITHPNVCRTFDIERHSSATKDGTSSDVTFLTMELLEGETLADLLRRRGRLTTAEAYPLVLQMIEALRAAHSAGIVHRDFKPSNVILVSVSSARASISAAHSNAPAIEEARVVVTDFGLARLSYPGEQVSAEHVATSFTGNQGLMGTLVYMAPEQFERGEATVATDIYSFGLVMYEMITGTRPFADSIPFAEAVKRLKQAAPSPTILVPELDPAWEAAIGRCLDTDAGKRFESVQELGEAITPAGQASTHRPKRQKADWKPAHLIARANSSSGRSRWWWVAALFPILVVSLSIIFLRHYLVRSSAKLAEGSTVLLTEIQNSTGDKRFDSTTEVIRHQLLQSPYFNLTDAGRVRDVLTQMKKPENAPLDPPTAREVAMRSGAPRVIFGAVSRVGDSYVLDLDIEQPDNDPRRARAQWENHWTWNMPSAALDKDIPGGFLTAVRAGSDWIRSQVGESANDIARMDVPPEEVTTASWDALSEFAEAEKLEASGQTEGSLIALHNAVEADPHFALAYTRLADELVSLNRYDEGYRAYKEALSLENQQRLTRREKDRLIGIYALDTEDFKTAEATFREYTVYYPSDYLGWFYRAYPLMMLGRVEEAIATLKRAADLNPSGLSAPSHIARFNLILGNFTESAKWIQYLRDFGYAEEASRIEGQSDFLQGRYQEAQARFEELKTARRPSYRSYSYSLLARLFAEQGQYRNALQTLDQGIDFDLETGDKGRRADKLLDRAYIEFKLSNYDVCLRDTVGALDLGGGMQRSLMAGTLLGQVAAVTTRPTKSLVMAQLRTIESRLPLGDFKPISAIVRAHLRGEILLAEHKWVPAVEEFRKADLIEAPNKDKEYLGRALLASTQHLSSGTEEELLASEAIAQYSKQASRPGLIWWWAEAYPPGYLADTSLSLARAMARSGKPDEGMLTEYLSRMSRADAAIRDVHEAEILLGLQRMETKPILRNQKGER